ncbi:MAG: GyrI-like domain-containing protein [Sphingomicrobium sp.]
MEKLDLKKLRKPLFTARPDQFQQIDVPPCRYLMVDGQGDPNKAPEYKQAVEALYSTAYTLKFMLKAQALDFAVAPLEGLWTASDPASFVAREKDQWSWTMMIMVPDFVDQLSFQSALAAASRKLDRDLTSTRLEDLHEGTCLQAMHVGSYDDEGPLLAKLHNEIMLQKNVIFAGAHHEIYLSDPRRTVPDKLKTILRQPVRPTAA